MRECPDHFYQQSAVVPLRRRGQGLQVMLIRSRKGKRWVIPKGVIEPELSPQDSAAKEALEEAGIVGLVVPEPLGHYRYEKWGDICTVQVFVMQVTEQFEHWSEDFRSREWLALEEAQQRLTEPALGEMLAQLPTFLAACGLR
ncbi:MAG: NUDIX hydrolase [Magnetococcales bacterium]|nr:NUDIX hydrolase [Magnetococcales bacterium]MBF0114916.1 NUDIX hydrolase [Magnetococcales bacterium]